MENSGLSEILKKARNPELWFLFYMHFSVPLIKSFCSHFIKPRPQISRNLFFLRKQGKQITSRELG